MNRLQRLAEPDDYVVTLNGADRVDQRQVIATMHYEHPIYTPESVAAQTAAARAQRRHARVRRRLPRLGLPRGRLRGRRARGGVAGGGVVTVVRGHGRATFARPALYDAEVRHVRHSALHRDFRHRVYLWLVDLDALPRLPVWLRPFARFAARDHLGDPARHDPRQPRPLSRHARDRPARRPGADARQRPRRSGYVFNPLTVYWCHRPDGHARVRRRGGPQHLRRAALLPPAHRRGRAGAGREGVLRVAVPARRRRVPRCASPCPTSGCALAITLRQNGSAAFAATVGGVRRPATPRSLVGMLTRRPLVTLRTSALIRRHGIALWLRRLPVIPRPRHAPQEGVQ